MEKRILNKKKANFLVIGIILVVILVVILSLAQLKKRAYRHIGYPTCINRLKQLGLALHMYAEEHSGWFPSSAESFINLYPNYAAGTLIFWCPGDRDPQPTNIINADLNRINSCQISYRYYPGFKRSDSPKTILLEDNSIQNHEGRGINQLYLSGYVKWIEKKNLESATSIKKRLILEIEKIKDKGEPITVEDLLSKKISDGENGALIYKEAFEIKENLEKKYEKEWYYLPYEGSVSWNEVPEQEKKGKKFNIF